MLIDITQGANVGVLTSNKKGSQTLKVEINRWLREFEGELKEDSMTVFSCGIHNMGTHIDMMKPTEIEKERFIAEGIKLNISHIIDRPVEVKDLDTSLIKEGIYVFFQTNWDKYLGDEKCFNHPEISMEVLEYLVSKKINMIGIDSLGLAKGKNHLVFDKYAADNNIYIIENLTNLNKIPNKEFRVYCFPLKIEALDALPARVLVEV
jgi:kynurenine formamidase